MIVHFLNMVLSCVRWLVIVLLLLYRSRNFLQVVVRLWLLLSPFFLIFFDRKSPLLSLYRRIGKALRRKAPYTKKGMGFNLGGVISIIS